MDQRVAEQAERLLNPTQADPSLSKYAHLGDFENMVKQAIQMEIADRRGDWEVPEIPVTDGQVEVRPADHLDAAVKAMRTPTSYGGTVEAKPDIVAEGLPDPETPLIVNEPLPPKPQGPIVTREQPKPKTFVPPTVTNAPTQQGAMIGGGPPPKAAPAADPVDPWAPPETPPAKKVQVGATVKMGGGK
jgi:hypothetical protein